MKRDIEIRNKLIIALYLRGVPRKQIPRLIVWTVPITYDTVVKVLQLYGHTEWKVK